MVVSLTFWLHFSNSFSWWASSFIYRTPYLKWNIDFFFCFLFWDHTHLYTNLFLLRDHSWYCSEDLMQYQVLNPDIFLQGSHLTHWVPISLYLTSKTSFFRYLIFKNIFLHKSKYIYMIYIWLYYDFISVYIWFFHIYVFL